MPGTTQKENSAEILSKGFLNAIKQFGDLQQTKNEIEGRRMKLETDMMAHQFQAKQNFFWKMKEKNEMTDYQKTLAAQFDKQNAQEQGAPDEQFLTHDVMTQRPQPSLTMGNQGFQVKNPEVGPKAWMDMLQKKMAWGIKSKNNQFAYFTKADKAFYDRQLSGKGNTDDDTEFLNEGLSPGSRTATIQEEPSATESPYPEYPDAVQEDGVWKVIREGKKYRLEE